MIKTNALHIAIDLGTAFSGFASSMQNADQKDVTLTFTYPDKPGGYEYCKQPSRLLYRKLVPNPTRREHYDFIATGFTVDKELQRVSTCLLELLNGLGQLAGSYGLLTLHVQKLDI
jgi:hypothetical protein